MSLYKKVKKMKGIIKVSIEGFFIERFINLCLQENIEIWELERINDGIINVKFSYTSYEKICDIAEITKCKINILEKKGIPFIVKRYKHRKIVVALICIIVILITVTNMFVWNVEIFGDFSIPIEIVRNLLDENDIKVGGLKSNLDIDAAKLNILLARSDIAWVGINLKGNKIVVEIVQKELVDDDIYRDTVGNIISDKTGLVEKIYVAEGTAMVKKGELVDVGTLLISGVVSKGITTKAGVLGENLGNQEIRYVRADGEILLKTTYVEKIKIPFEKDIVSKTGNVEKTYKMKLNNCTINLINKVTNYEKYDKITNEKVFSLFGHFKMPITLVEESFEEIKVDTIRFTEKQAEELGIITNNGKLKEIIPEDAERINYYNNIWKNEDYLEVETVVQCLEKTGTYEKIEGKGK